MLLCLLGHLTLKNKHHKCAIRTNPRNSGQKGRRTRDYVQVKDYQTDFLDFTLLSLTLKSQNQVYFYDGSYVLTKLLYNITVPALLIYPPITTHRVNIQSRKSLNFITRPGLQSWLCVSPSIAQAPFLISSPFCTQMGEEDCGANLADFRLFIRECRQHASLQLLLVP